MRRTGKKSIVGGVVALSLILMGTGYAYWTDTLNITTKATTGDFDVTFADLGLYAQYDSELKTGGWSIVDGVGSTGFIDHMQFARGKSDYNSIAAKGSIEEYYEGAKNYNSVEFDAELTDAEAIKKKVGDYTTANTNGSDQINIEVKNMYPGYAQAFRSDILNVGELAATLGAVKFEVQEDGREPAAAAKDMLGIALYINGEEDTSGQLNGSVFQLATQFSKEDVFQVGGVNFVRLSALENGKLPTILENNTILCNSDHRMDLFLGVAMDPDESGKYTTGKASDLKANDDSESQLKSASISIDFIWEQFNVGKDAANGNILIEQN